MGAGAKVEPGRAAITSVAETSHCSRDRDNARHRAKSWSWSAALPVCERR